MHREDIPLHLLLSKIEKRLVDPDFGVPKTLLERVSAALLSIETANFRDEIWATTETHTFDITSLMLAARAPDVVAAFIHKIVATIPERKTKDLYGVSMWLGEFSLLLDGADLQVLTDTLESFRSTTDPEVETQHLGRDPNVTEAFLFLAMAPHLSPDELLSILLNRSSTALDLLRLQPWFAPPTASKFEQTMTILRAPLDDVSVVRILWFIAQPGISLTPEDKTHISHLADSKNRKVRGAALRVAVISGDEDLGKLIVDLGQIYRDNSDFWDTIWGPRVLSRFSKHISFDSLVKRLDPVDLGFALANRASELSETSFYAGILDTYFDSIAVAPQPQIESLPAVCANPEGEKNIGAFPSIERHDTSSIGRPERLLLSPQPENVIPENFLEDMKSGNERLNKSIRERAAAVKKAWNSDALQWFGKTFSDVALRRVCLERWDLVNKWVSFCLNESPRQQTVRLRLGGLLAQLCPIVLELHPSVGLKLWRALQAGNSFPLAFDGAFAVFAAPVNGETDVACLEELYRCSNDESLSRIGFLAEMYGRKNWLMSTSQALIAEGLVWKKAFGITLASFSNISLEDFDALTGQAQVQESWFSEHLGTVRLNVQRNYFAQTWYGRYLSDANDAGSWGALQMMMECADERFLTWRGIYEHDLTGKRSRRLRLLESNSELRDKLGRGRERRKSFLGIKSERIDIFPFVRN